MAGLESQLTIRAADETAKAFSEVQARIKSLEAAAAGVEKVLGNMGRLSSEANAFGGVAQRDEMNAAIANMERLIGLTERATQAQRDLAVSAGRVAGVLRREDMVGPRGGVRPGGGLGVVEGAEGAALAARAAGREHDPFHRESMLPMAGPGILEGTKELVTSGASVEEEIARLKAAGAQIDEIDKAREQFRAISKRYSGMTEADYLAGYKDARVIAPSESFEMAELGARYKLGLRNSGVSSSEYDVGNVLRIMDEIGLKSTVDREHFLDSFLKSQQAFGGQITTETALAAYRNAKQSIYDWSPEFREKYFPTLLQSAGQQGGTEMMTALNNYVGHHMQKTEIESLVKAGFVRPQDVSNDHGHVSFKDGAQLFESDVFKQNIAKWAWDFHDTFMKRDGATEDKFGDLISKMPRNMAGLIAFLVHNRQRIERDAETLDKPVGLKAAEDQYLSANPVAGLEALEGAIKQFAAAVSQPEMQAIGAGLQEVAHGVQAMAAAYGDWAKANPKEAQAAGGAATVAGAAAGGYLSWKLFAGVGKLFGFGGGEAAASGASASAASKAMPFLGRLGLLGSVILGAEALDPKGDFGGATAPVDSWFKKHLGFDPSNVPIEIGKPDVSHVMGGSFWRDLDAGKTFFQNLFGGGVQLDPNSKADVHVTVHVDASPELQAHIAGAEASSSGNLAAHVGAMGTEAAPRRVGGIGHM